MVRKTKQNEETDLDSEHNNTLQLCQVLVNLTSLAFNHKAESERKIFFNPSDQGQNLILSILPLNKTTFTKKEK